MFELLTVRDVIRIPPPALPPTAEGATDAFRDALKSCIAAKFVGRVVPNHGYCVSVADVLSWGDSRVLAAGDGSVWTRVEFTLIVFKVFLGERLRATIEQQTSDGITLTLYFWPSVFVDASRLLPGSFFDDEKQMWMISVETEEAADSTSEKRAGSISSSVLASQQPRHVQPYRKDDEVIFAVHSCTMPTENEEPAEARNNSKAGRPAMVIEGSFLGPGLGPVAWW